MNGSSTYVLLSRGKDNLEWFCEACSFQRLKNVTVFFCPKGVWQKKRQEYHPLRAKIRLITPENHQSTHWAGFLREANSFLIAWMASIGPNTSWASSIAVSDSSASSSKSAWVRQKRYNPQNHKDANYCGKSTSTHMFSQFTFHTFHLPDFWVGVFAARQICYSVLG